MPLPHDHGSIFGQCWLVGLETRDEHHSLESVTVCRATCIGHLYLFTWRKSSSDEFSEHGQLCTISLCQQQCFKCSLHVTKGKQARPEAWKVSSYLFNIPNQISEYNGTVKRLSLASHLEDLTNRFIQHFPVQFPTHFTTAQVELLLLQILKAKRDRDKLGWEIATNIL